MAIRLWYQLSDVKAVEDMTNAQMDDKPNHGPQIYLSIASFGIISIVFLYGVFLFYCVKPENFQTSGVFGDSYGLLNSLFTGLAFAILIVTLYVQQNLSSHILCRGRMSVVLRNSLNY